MSQSSKAAPPTPSELLECHYTYEIGMLQQTYAYLGNREHAKDEVIRYALIESFCIHARNLIEFFDDKNGDKPNAKKYAEASYVPLDSNRGRLNRLKIMLNNQIAHLDKLRTSNQNEKIGDSERKELIKILMTQAEEFKAKLKAKYRPLRLPNTTVDITSTGAGATNVVSQAGTTGSLKAHVILATQPTDPTKPA